MPESPENFDEAADGGLRTTALFACPFCGAEAEITDESQPDRPKSWFFAWCKNRPECNSWLAAGSPEKVAEKWNKRASPWCDSCKEPDCKVSMDGTCAMIRKYLANDKGLATQPAPQMPEKHK